MAGEINLSEQGDLDVVEDPPVPGGTLTLVIKAALRTLITNAVQPAALALLQSAVDALSGTVGGHTTSLGTHTTQIGTLQSDVSGHVGAANPHSGSVPTSRTITTGAASGLTGGAALSSNLSLGVVWGAAAATSCAGNDARLSDARVPTVAALVDGDMFARAGGALAGKQLQLFAVGASDVPNATTTLANVTGLAAALKANSTYSFLVDFDYTTSATSVGLQMSTAFSGTTTAVRFGLAMGTSATAYSNTQATAHGTKVGPTATGPGATARSGTLRGTLVTGATPGTLNIQLAAGAAGTATIRARSTLLVMQL